MMLLSHSFRNNNSHLWDNELAKSNVGRATRASITGAGLWLIRARQSTRQLQPPENAKEHYGSSLSTAAQTTLEM